MKKDSLTTLLRGYRAGRLSLRQVRDRLAVTPYQQLAESTVDLHRELRTGVPEVVFCERKTDGQLVEVFGALGQAHRFVIGTRLDADAYVRVRHRLPVRHRYFERARVLCVGIPPRPSRGNVLVLTAGSTDIPVAEEAAVVCELLGNRVERCYDVGVAGIHRLNAVIPKMRRARVVIVVAGMDGALPSVIGGLSRVPVIAVPTSIGYGASFRGVGPLLTMLNACAPGVTVVNIDNGFNAGYVAHLINRRY
jgi:NCAIR mutase (PurE)-related protein